jgi:hypothetical protein
MKIDLDARRVAFEMTDCASCAGRGTNFGRKPCPKCHGTNRTKGGKGKGQCRYCFGGTVVDKDKRVTCKACGGSGQRKETRFDPCDALNVFPIKVYRQDRGISFNESYLGLDCISSCTDYGAAWERDNDAELIENVKGDRYVQACRIVKEDGTLADHIGVFVNRGGYSIRAIFGDVDAVADKAKREPSESLGMFIGSVVAAAGGNGTMAAAGK